MAKKFDFYWADLSRIIKDLEDERTEEAGPDWERVLLKSVDLASLSRAALHLGESDGPAKSRRWWFLGR